MQTNTSHPTTLISFLRHLLPDIQTQEERDEIYLADSVDIYDLELRMREIDSRGRQPEPGLQFGLGLR
ncbi:MAG: DUF3563 family protein [Ideonella sp.]